MRSKKSYLRDRFGPDWDGSLPLAGVDEVGRGPLAGPVVAAAVVLDAGRPIRGLTDSKLLTPAERERLSVLIHRRALCCSIASASVAEIDEINILRASLLAMRRAVEGLALQPQRVVVDGNMLPTLAMPARAVVQGDLLVQAISAASIIAKVHRDRLCHALHAEHPRYGFHAHKGYATVAHLKALREHGACSEHRRSFRPVRVALGLESGPWPPEEPGARSGRALGEAGDAAMDGT